MRAVAERYDPLTADVESIPAVDDLGRWRTAPGDGRGRGRGRALALLGAGLVGRRRH